MAIKKKVVKSKEAPAPVKEVAAPFRIPLLDDMADLIDGTLFDVPKKAAKKAEDTVDDAADETEVEEEDSNANQNARRTERAIVNINLGNLFKRIKPKDGNGDSRTTETEKGKTPGEQE